MSMYASGEHGVPHGEHVAKPNAKTLPDWEGARLFLEVVRRGSFRAAADNLGSSVNALRRRISEFEQTLGVVLMTRHVDGVRLTTEGEQVHAAAARMESASFDLVRARDRVDSSLEGEVRLALTEGLGTFWVAPKLVDFQRANPRLLLDVNCAMRSADVLRLEADIAVQLTRPSAKNLKIVKLGRLHLLPFVAKSYVETYGAPKNLIELINHRIVVQSDEQPLWQDLYERLFPGLPPKAVVTLRTNASSAHLWSIAQGAGIGMLPTYIHAMGAGVVPLDIGIHVPLDIWLTYHVDAAKIPRVRRLIDWLAESFSPRKYPWFRDELIAPEELAKSYKGQPLMNLFSGFMGAD